MMAADATPRGLFARRAPPARARGTGPAPRGLPARPRTGFQGPHGTIGLRQGRFRWCGLVLVAWTCGCGCGLGLGLRIAAGVGLDGSAAQRVRQSSHSWVHYSQTSISVRGSEHTFS
jgi:hypothetical protein